MCGILDSFASYMPRTSCIYFNLYSLKGCKGAQALCCPLSVVPSSIKLMHVVRKPIFLTELIFLLNEHDKSPFNNESIEVTTKRFFCFVAIECLDTVPVVWLFINCSLQGCIQADALPWPTQQVDIVQILIHDSSIQGKTQGGQYLEQKTSLSEHHTQTMQLHSRQWCGTKALTTSLHSIAVMTTAIEATVDPQLS